MMNEEEKTLEKENTSDYERIQSADIAEVLELMELNNKSEVKSLILTKSN